MNGTLQTLKPLVSEKYLKVPFEELCVEYKDGLSPEIFATVFDRMFKLILHSGTKFTSISSEDLASISLTTLDTAMRTFTDKGAKFTTYFTTCLGNALKNEVTRNHKYLESKMSESLDEPVFDDSSTSLYETLADERFENFHDVDLRVTLESFLPKLPTRRREMLEMFLNGGEDLTDPEIAKFYGCAVTNVNRTRKDLRKDLIKYGFAY